MTREAAPTAESNLAIGEFTADSQTWAQISTVCETILGGLDDVKISQRTWEPDTQPQALQRLGISYGLTMRLSRVGQTEPTMNTMYELTFNGRDYSGMYLFEPYRDNPTATLAGDQPRLVAPADMPAARLNQLVDYLNTYLGE